MKTKKGMYVRTKYGTIAKIEAIITDECVECFITDIELMPNIKYELSKKDIIKASYDLIDLVEEGDYVNGQPVIKHAYQDTLYVECDYVGGRGFTTIECYTQKLENVEISSIVTHEQFDSMKYEVK